MLLLAFASAGMCQTESVQESEPASLETLEEIIVYGNKSMHSLRQELYMAEENLFAVFNSLNSDDEYDINCDYEVRLASRKRQHVCMPNFAQKNEADAASAFMAELQRLASNSQGTGGASYPIRARARKMEYQMWKEMAAMVSEHPELREALIRLASANKILESERERRCEDRILFCRK